jgi:hypothetical protein
MVYGLITLLFESSKLGSSPSGATKKYKNYEFH